MDIMDNSIIYLIVSNICTGGLSWFATLRFTRKEAEASAMEKMQRVYESLVTDLLADRQMLKDDNSFYKGKISELEQRVAANEQILASTECYLCRRALACHDRELMEIPGRKLPEISKL